jgi:hypothetical protein
MQVALPMLTAILGGGVGFGFGRLNRFLDDRKARREAKASARAAETAVKDAAEAKKKAAGLPNFRVHWDGEDRFRLQNINKRKATGITVAFKGVDRMQVNGLRDEPFTLEGGAWVAFGVPGVYEMDEIPEMWVMCHEYTEPARVLIPEKFTW